MNRGARDCLIEKSPHKARYLVGLVTAPAFLQGVDGGRSRNSSTSTRVFSE